jgi:DNA-binding transcriptional regulator/RsmH inhibitor MraZ
VDTPLHTSRLSPKNQATLPREARALAGGQLSQLRALPTSVASPADPARRFPTVILMSEAELTRREQAIRADSRLNEAQRLHLVMQLNAGSALLAIDDQRRVVLPPRLVEHLRLTDRDIFFVPSNDVIFVWSPAEYLAYARPADSGPDLSHYLLV